MHPKVTIAPLFDDMIWGVPGAVMGPPVDGAEAFTTTPVLDLLRAATARSPQAIALTSQTGELTYAELLRLACNAASAIAMRVHPAGTVACVLPRTPEAIAALLGCLISGRLALILDPANPAERLAALLDDAGPALVFVDRPLPFPLTAPVLTLPAALEDGSDNDWRPDRAWDPDAPFAVHFTSGSTGRPKGIVLSARSVLFRGLDGAQTFGLTERDRVFAHSVPIESNGLPTLLAALAKGARVVLATVATEGAGAILRLLEREAVTAISSSPAILRMLFRMERATKAFGALRVLRVGAGLFTTTDLAAWSDLLPPGCAILHPYASTEALVMAQWFVPRGQSGQSSIIAVGMLQPNHEFAILDEHNAPVSFGETGELVLRSRYVALGEWQGGRMVPGRMLPAPSRPGHRVFRTGDLVRLEPGGMLRLLGRADRQVKINGVRIEPAEIEAVLRSDPRVTEAAVIPRAGTGEVVLHGFVAATAVDVPELIAALKARLSASLPGASRPARLTVLDRLPVLPGGKIDLVALSNWTAS